VQLPTNDPSAYAGVQDSQNRFYFPRSFHEIGQLSNGAVEVARELTKRGVEGLSQGLTKRSATYEGIQEDMGMNKPVMNYSIGLSAVLIAALISGLTGVYFEKVLKESQQHVTVWTRNVQLSFYSLFPALIIGVIFKDGEEIAKEGFFAGYNSVVWTAVVFQAVGGVLVAMCINYADNIAKNFATSISIILSFLFSVWFFEFKVTLNVSSASSDFQTCTNLHPVPFRHSNCHFCHISLQRPRPQTQPPPSYQHSKLRENNNRQWLYAKIRRGQIKPDAGSNTEPQERRSFNIETCVTNETPLTSRII